MQAQLKLNSCFDLNDGNRIPVLGLGVFGVWVAMTIDWAVRAVCFLVRYLRGNWQKKTAAEL